MNKGIFVTIFGTIISLAALAAWFYTAPAAGSGWILCVAFLGSLGLLNSIHENVLGTIASFTIAAAAGTVWFVSQGMPHAGWVLALAILAGLSTFNSLNTAVSDQTTGKTKRSKKSASKAGESNE